MAALPDAERRHLWVSAWLGEDEARLRRDTFDPPLEAPASLAEPREWLRDPERLRRNLVTVLPAEVRRSLAVTSLRFAGHIPAAVRAELAASPAAAARHVH